MISNRFLVLVFVLVSQSAFAWQDAIAYQQYYLPDSLPPEVKTVQSYGYDDVRDGDFSKDGDKRDGLFNKDNTIEVSLEEGEHDNGNHFIEEKVGKISGKILEDTNNDDLGDQPIQGVQVFLLNKYNGPARDALGKIVKPTFSDENGYYEFINLAADDYVITKVRPVDYPTIDEISEDDTQVEEKAEESDPSSIANKSILLVESSIEKNELSFLPFRTHYGNYHYQDIRYASHPTLGTGYGVELELPPLYAYEMVFIKMDMGSFSSNMIKEIADYILTGGKVYLIFDAYERPFYLDRMEEDVNLLLKYLFIEDRIKFSHELVDNAFQSGLVKNIDDVKRQKAIADSKKKARAQMDHSEKFSYDADDSNPPILTSMGKGHYIKPISDMSEAYSICQFENGNDKYITNVFWKVRSGGLGIGTEKITSAYLSSGSIDAWKIIQTGFDIE